MRSADSKSPYLRSQIARRSRTRSASATGVRRLARWLSPRRDSGSRGRGVGHRSFLLVQARTHAVAVAPPAKHQVLSYTLVTLRFELDGISPRASPAARERNCLFSLRLRSSRRSHRSAWQILPGAEAGIELEIDDADHLVVAINGQPVMTPADRVSLLRAAHGQVCDLRLDDIVRLSENELGRSLSGANLVLVRSQEIDEQGETGKLNIGLNGFDATVREVSRAVARLANHELTDSS